MLSIDEEARRRFESDWLSSESQSLSIREYLPRAESESYLGTLEELVCIDLEFRWRQNHVQQMPSGETVSAAPNALPTRVEDYLREFPELNQPDVVARLVEQEIEARAAAGFVVEPSEYFSRFPGIDLKETVFSAAGGAGRGQADGETRPDSAGDLTHGCIEALPHSFGPYVLTDRIGRGGMGAVYRARQPAAGRDVAIKIADVSSPSAHAREAVKQRFETEAHAAAGIIHDNVVPIFDVGSIDGSPYYAMRLVEGGDLAGLTKESTLPPRTAARYLAEIARGVAAAHAKGLLHRDIKPQNILIDPDTGRALLTDFGLARAMAADSSLTHAGQVLGTPSYMPPEQIKDSSKIDQRADVYALGGTLYQAVTGRAPFKASDVHETLKQVVSDDPIPARRLNPSVPTEIDTIVAKCLEKEPERRYQSADEVADELERYLAGKPILARPASPIVKLVKWSRRNGRLASAFAVAISATAIALGVSIYGWQRTSQLLATSTTLSRTTLNALGEMTQAIDEEPAFNLPDVAAKRKQLLARVLDHYEALIQEQVDGDSGQVQNAIALTLAGRLSLQLDRDNANAAEYFDAAIDTLTSLDASQHDAQPNKPVLMRTHSDAWIGLGNIARKKEDWPKALDCYQKAESIRRSWVELDDGVEANRKLANAIMNQGLIHRRLGEIQLAETRQLDAQQIRNRFLRNQAGAPEPDAADEASDLGRLRRDSSKANFNLGMLALANDDTREAADRLGSASREFRQQAEDSPSDTRTWRLLAECLVYEARVASIHGFQVEAGELFAEAIEDLLPVIAISIRDTHRAAELLSLAQVALDGLIETAQTIESTNEVSQLPTEYYNRIARPISALLGQIDDPQNQLDEDTIVAVRGCQLTSYRHHALMVGRAEAIEILDSAIELGEQAREECSTTEAQMQIEEQTAALEHLRTIFADTGIQP
ncbi:MAG: hypothetical protein Aurels2KO_45990 [Aureliella sp.]